MSEYPPEVTTRFEGDGRSGLVGERPRRWSSIVIEDYDPAWAERYAAASAEIAALLGPRVLGLEHVGSTSVPGLAAKPVIDIDLLLEDTADEKLFVPALETAGYRLVLRKPWWYGHRMLIGGDEDIHVHVWPRNAPEPIRHRLFRDWLRTHPDDRDLYATTKRHLARAETGNYTLSKNDVIDQIFARIFAT